MVLSCLLIYCHRETFCKYFTSLQEPSHHSAQAGVARGYPMCVLCGTRAALPLAGVQGQAYPLCTPTHGVQSVPDFHFPVHSGCKINANTAPEHCL